MRYTAGQNVGPGFYWNPSTGEQHNVRSKATLPGAPGEIYLRLPRGAMLLIAPILGGVFVMFLPVIGIVLTAQVILNRLRK